MGRDPFTFLNQFAPLRFHPRTREQIMEYVVQHKPLGNPYFGMVLAQRTVAAIIKNDKKIDVVPAGKPSMCFKLLDINVIFNYIQSKKQKTSVIRFDQICLPGMTEECRLSVFVHRDDETPIKVVYVSDDSSQEQLEEFEKSSTNILRDLANFKINQVIADSEKQMFTKISKFYQYSFSIDMKEVLNVIICHNILE